GSVPAEQTYLDVTQGNRVFDSLYEGKLPSSESCASDFWRAVDERADSAPAEIVPGLLTSTLESAGVGASVGAGTSCTFSSPTIGRQQQTTPPKKLSGGPRRHPPNAK